jgi:hypothetical protein
MRNQRGIALLVAIIVAILLSLLGLSLTFMSLKEAATSTEFENHEKALMIADGGLHRLKSALRGDDLSALLSTSSTVGSYSTGTVTGYAVRMPILAIDARNVDFENPPTGGARTVTGLLTPPTGDLISVGDVRGRFFGKVTDNQDEAPLGLADDPLVDQDGKVYVRVVGIYRGTGGEVNSYGSSAKNSVAVLEALLERDMSFNLQSPLSFYGHNANINFAGNSFTIDGYDHRGMTFDEITGKPPHSDAGLNEFYGVSCLYDDETGGDATSAVSDVNNALSKNQKNNITGAGGFPSITDGTQDVRDSPNEDAANIFNAEFLAHFVQAVSAVADIKYTTDTHLSSDAVLGTAEHRQITVCEGDLELTGSGTGAGILIVKGAFKVGGSFTYDGVILVVGEGDVELGGTNKSFVGGMYVANMVENPDGTHGFGVPTLNDSGNSNFYMKSDSILLGYSLLPMRLVSWREITPEIEPGS